MHARNVLVAGILAGTLYELVYAVRAWRACVHFLSD